MNFIPASRVLGNCIGIACHAKKESLIWTISVFRIRLGEFCQQGSLRILNVGTALTENSFTIKSVGFSEYILF